jgi:YD repeat-containing protein
VGALVRRTLWLAPTSGNLTEKIDRTGRITEYTYDALDRRTRELWKTSGGSTVRSIDYAFEDRGFLASLSENDGNPSNLFYNFDYEYDQWGRNTSATYDYKGSLASGVGHVGSGSTHFTTHFTAQVTMDTTYRAFGPRSQLEIGTVESLWRTSRTERTTRPARRRRSAPASTAEHGRRGRGDCPQS